LLAHSQEAAMSEIRDVANKVANMISEISAASQQQASGVDQVNVAIMQIDEMTQLNAAMAERPRSQLR
jgi:methyl-accepting chemotaxis protein